MTDQKTELVHYGVKGMKWGQRRAEANKPNAGYSRNDRVKDTLRFNSGGVKRINRRMNKGADLRTARKKEGQRTLIKAAAIVALYNSPRVINATLNAVDKHGGNLASNIAQKAETKRGRATAAATMGLPRTASTGPNYAKKSKGGSYKITSV
jgi:hypothetical protein